MKRVIQFFERNDIDIIRSHLIINDDFLFPHKNLYPLHFHLSPDRM